jgi:pilus assembly protein Flp/PilA
VPSLSMPSFDEIGAVAAAFNTGATDSNLLRHAFDELDCSHGSCLKILPSGQARISSMLEIYFKAADGLKRLRADQEGLVSFEYMIVAACIITAVSAAFNTGGTVSITNALTTGINTIGTSVTTAVGS